jgi:hypothetical protein
MQFRRLALAMLTTAAYAQVQAVQQKTTDGVLEGVISADGKVRTFKGIPFAAPPVGPLRWKAPQPPGQRHWRFPPHGIDRRDRRAARICPAAPCP